VHADDSSFVRGIAELRCLAPCLEQGGGLFHVGALKAIRRRVLDRRHSRSRDQAAGRVDDVADCESVTDDEDPLLGTGEHEPEPLGEAPSCSSAALSAARGRLVGRVSGRPRPVRIERPAVEGAEVDLVELRRDENGNVATVERPRERLLGARLPRGLGDRDVLARQHASELARLLDAVFRKTLARNLARRDAVAIRGGERVPDEQEVSHG
jgi:hypothetical protein